MGLFRAYRNPNPATRIQQFDRLNPTIVIDGNSFIIMTQEIAGVDRNQLGDQTYDLASYRPERFAALD